MFDGLLLKISKFQKCYLVISKIKKKFNTVVVYFNLSLN